MATYHSRLSTVELHYQASATGLIPATPAAFAATSGGSATSIVSTGLQGDADSNDDYVGYIVEAVGGTSGNLGLMRRVMAYDDSSGTLTIEALPAASVSGDRYRLWTRPQGWWAAETALTAGAATKIHDAARTEAAGTYVGSEEEAGPYLVVQNAASLPSTSLPLITNQSNGYVETANWGAAIAVGDLVEAVYFPELMSDARLELAMEPLQRTGPVGSYGRPGHARGNRSVSGTLELAFRGPGASRIGDRAEAHMLLRCVCDHTLPSDATVDAGATTTTIPVSSGTPVAGRMYALDVGDLLMCSAYSAPNATASPAVRTAPQSGQTLYGITTYTPSTGANGGLAAIQHRGDGIREEFWGLLPALSFSGARGDWLKITAQMTGTDGYRAWKDHTGTAFARPWRPKLSTVDPVRLTDCRVVIGGVELDVDSFSLDLGQVISPKGGLKNANEAGGVELVDDAPTGQLLLKASASALAELDSFLAGEQQVLFLQAGAAPGFPGLFGFWAYRAVYTGGSLADADGQIQITLPFAVVLDQAETTLPRWAIGIA